MANELPEVVPKVSSMPTTGWFCQTTGNARRRVTSNTSTYKSGRLDLEGTFQVTGVPGHTHNANAVVSIDANYSKYRERALTVPARVWGNAALAFPVGQLTDSEEPDNAEERYDRAIERCVGYTALFPENCSGHIREPTRSIGEIRTLVAPKSRLDTLTYAEERAGWRFPGGADDEQNEDSVTPAPLLSEFPDVYLDMRPTTRVIQNTIDPETSPHSLYLESPAFRYRIIAAVQNAFIGTKADGSEWDGTLRFVWDDDERLYRTLGELAVTLDTVQECARDTGVDVANEIYDVAIGGAPVLNHKTRITVTFPILKTTRAFDGYCWLANFVNEEALNYASRTTGLALAPRIDVEVIGITTNVGPFQWIGIPAYRIPVGGTYAFPAADILQQMHGDGTHTDLQTNFYDKFDGFSTLGILRYQFRQQSALVAHNVAVAAGQAQPIAEALAKTGAVVFRLDQRQVDVRGNTGFFEKRDGSSILGQVSAHQYDEQPNFDADIDPYIVGLGGVHNLPQADLLVSDMSASLRLRSQTAELNNPSDLSESYTGTLAGPDIPFSATGTMSITFPDAYGGPFMDGFTPHTSDQYAIVPFTPVFYQANDALLSADRTGDPLLLGAVDAIGARHRVPLMICNIDSVVGRTLNIRYDLRSQFTGTPLEVTGGTIHATTGLAGRPNRFYDIAGFAPWLHVQHVSSSFEAAGGDYPGNVADAAQDMRNEFRDAFRTGNRFLITTADDIFFPGAGGNAEMFLRDHVFATDGSLPYVYFETYAGGGIANEDIKFMFRASIATSSILYTDDGFGNFDQGTAVTRFVDIQAYTQTALLTGIYTPTQAEFLVILQAGAQNDFQNLHMYIPGIDWYKTHDIGDPYATIREESERIGPVFQSIKRISQHICAPVLNPNLRIGASAPLNHDSRHLPPEIRDFRLQLQDIDWGRLLTDRVSIKDLSLYEFRDGVQRVGAQQNVMYLPEFRETQHPVSQGVFDFTVFSELGSPSYFCFFCRSATTDILQQPLIKTLSIQNETTKKKSNTIRELSIGQLYHLTQRNVHPGAEYDRAAFNRRQTILLSTEDVGMMGLKSTEYQSPKRVQYRFIGNTDRGGVIYVLLAYNNRGLHIDGRRLQVVTLHE